MFKDFLLFLTYLTFQKHVQIIIKIFSNFLNCFINFLKVFHIF